MRLKRRQQGLSLAVLIVTGALVAGCGGGDDSSTTTQLSQSEFVAKATAICIPGNKQIDAAVHRYLGAGKPSSQDVKQFVSKAVVPVTQSEIDQFRQLTPPARQADTYQALLDVLQSVNEKVKANPQLLGASSQGDPFAKAQQLARQAGLAACAEA